MIRALKSGKRVALGKCRYCEHVMRVALLSSHVYDGHPQEWDLLRMRLRREFLEEEPGDMTSYTSSYVARLRQKKSQAVGVR